MAAVSRCLDLRRRWIRLGARDLAACCRRRRRESYSAEQPEARAESQAESRGAHVVLMKVFAREW